MYLKSIILSIALVMIGTVVSYGQGLVTRTNKPTKKKTEKNLNPINTKKHDIIQSNEEGSIKEKKDDRHLLELLDRDPHGTINGHEYVDLGLPSRLKWATCNIGADDPTVIGDYYAWGEVSPSSTYDRTNSRMQYKSLLEMVKEGVIDAKLGNITKTYDVATANWGSTWRTPSLEDFQEVLNNCNISLITKGTSTGFSITGPNGHSIFLPLTGQYIGSYLLDSEIGYYWSSTIHRPKELGPIDNCGYYLKIGNDEQNISWLSLFVGLPIRAVSE